MKLPTYNGWPIVANFSPIEGKWEVKTRRKGVPRGCTGKVPLRVCLKELLDWCKDSDNNES